ncbi:MAG: glycosyltransferase [Candidatus Omnitrophica bacterium]|nr:glycosyltransferase [Candidatus Omnitrophota bacterium]
MLDFICFSINAWEKRRARKQQFMLHLSLREDVGKVLYVEPPLNIFRLLFLPHLELQDHDNRVRWLRALKFKVDALPESRKLFIFTPLFLIPFAFRLQFIYNLNLFICFLIIKAKSKIMNFDNVVLWLYHPFDYPLLKWFKKRIVSCFDWAEDWQEYFTELPRNKRLKVAVFEERIIKKSDVVFVVSKVLLERAKKINPNTFQLFDGTNPEIFRNYNNGIPPDIKNIPHPIIGYVGNIFTRFDIDLVCQLSESFFCSVVLIGNVLLEEERISKIKEKHNIFILGAKSFNELPGYLLNFDVCILPYISSLVTSPATKVYDYLASGKPIVSTQIPGLDEFGDLLKVSRSNEEFINLVKSSLNEDNVTLQNLRKEKASQNSWGIRSAEIMGIISKNLK